MVMGVSHVVPGQEASSQSHTSSQNERDAGLGHQSYSEGTTSMLQGTCVAAPTGDMASVGTLTHLPWEGSWGYKTYLCLGCQCNRGIYAHLLSHCARGAHPPRSLWPTRSQPGPVH